MGLGEIAVVIIRVSVRPTLQVLGFGRTVGVRQISTVVGIVLSTAHCENSKQNNRGKFHRLHLCVSCEDSS